MMEVVKIDTKITKAFKVNILEVQNMVKKYQELTLIPEDEDSYKICRKALTSCIRTRTGIDKRRKELNKKAQTEIKGRNTAAGQLAAIIEPAEIHLTGLVKGEDGRIAAIEEEEKRKEHEKISVRVMALGKCRVILPFMEVAIMTDEEFETALASAKTEWDVEEKRQADAEAARKAEEERLAKQKADQDAEAARLAGIKSAQEADQAAREAVLKVKEDAIAAREQAIHDEKTRIAKVEADKKAAEAKEEADKEAAEEARIQVIEDAIINKKAKAEEAARLKTLQPIKDRICDYADDIRKETPPKFGDKDAQNLMDWAWEELALLSSTIKEKAGAL